MGYWGGRAGDMAMEIARVALSFLGLISLINLVVPFWPFRSRAQAIGGLVLSMFGIGSISNYLEREPSQQVVAEAPRAPCPDNTAQSGRTLRITGRDANLRVGPGTNFDRTVNSRASEIAKKPVYVTVSAPTKVIEECRTEGWSRISMAERSEFSEIYKGWIAHPFLRELPGPNEAPFTEADILFDKETRPYRSMILRAVNKIALEDSRCRDSLDPSSPTMSSQSTKAVPVFFVTCGKAGGVVNVFFRESDLAPGKTFTAPVHVNAGQAVEACERRAKSSATHPQTVSFSRFMDLATVQHPNGRTTVSSSFTASNAFGMKLKYNIRCLFDTKSLIEAEITEAN